MTQTMAELVATYNAMAKALKLPSVKRFADRPTAIKRVRKITRSAKMSQAKLSPNREKLLAALLPQMDQPVPVGELAQAVYGDATKTGKLGMVVKGLLADIAAGKVSYVLRKEKHDGQICLRLTVK